MELEAQLCSESRQLKDAATKQYKRNAQLYERLRASDIFIDFPLYVPPFNGRSRSMELDRAQLLSIIDRLLAQEERLSHLQRKLKFREEASTGQEDLKNLVERSYGFLRKAWAQDPAFEEGPDDKLDRIGRIVGGIRGNLSKLLNSHRKRVKPQQLEEVLLQSQSYTQLKEAYERLMMQREETQLVANEKLADMDRKLKLKDRENEQLRADIKQHKERIRKLQNQSIAAEARLQEVTGRLNSIKFEQERQERRTKVHCKGSQFELVVTAVRSSEESKVVLETTRQLQDILRFLQEGANPSPVKLPEPLQESTNDSYQLRHALVSPIKSPAKYGNGTREQLISQVRFNRTHSLVSLMPAKRKAAEESSNNGSFYTKMQLIGGNKDPGLSK